MKNIVFVGDEPSPLNVHPDIPFVGARCFRMLCDWIEYLKPNYYICLNSKEADDIQKIKELYNWGFKVVALGNVASERLDNSEIRHHTLPHPSPLNRKLNDIKEIEILLNSAKEFIEKSEENISGRKKWKELNRS